MYLLFFLQDAAKEEADKVCRSYEGVWSPCREVYEPAAFLARRSLGLPRTASTSKHQRQKMWLSGEILDGGCRPSSTGYCCIITSQASEMSTDIDNGKRQVDNDSYLEIDFFLEIIRAL